MDVAIREGGRVCMVSEENKVRMFDLSFCLFVPPHSYLHVHVHAHAHVHAVYGGILNYTCTLYMYVHIFTLADVVTLL